MSISHQLHSRNDLREWNAMFKKGATSIKIDPHFVRTSDRFILSHDVPHTPWQLRHNRYNTLDDVLLYLEFAPSFLRGRSIDIALCFKSAPKICDPNHKNSKAVQKWMSMADKFFAEANQIVRHVKETMDITLTFVLDGDGKPCNCLADKFQPWKSTWIDSDKCSVDCFNSDEGFCNRFAILNNPTSSDWVALASNKEHYGKFGNKNHTLQVWEPDSQTEISNLIQDYLQGQAEGVPSGGGLTFSINVDAAMFNTFTARTLDGHVDSNGFNLLIEDGEAKDATGLNLVYQSPGKVSLQYELPSAPVNRQVTRQVSFEAFQNINVGPPSKEDDRMDSSLESLLEKDIHAATLRLSSRSYGLVRRRFGNGKLLSWSDANVGDFSFLFVAAGGKVYASVKHNKADYSDFTVIGLGNSVHASSLNSTLLIVTEGNHCYNAHIDNTRSAPLVCQPTLHTRDACPYALDYSVGTVENWFLWLQRSDAVITACNEYILHGTFSGGVNPSGILFPLDDTKENKGKVGIMVAHKPFPLHANSRCGTPITGESGIVISSFSSPVVQDRFAESIHLGNAERNALESNGSWDSIHLMLGLVIGLLLTAWFVIRRRNKPAYELLES